MTDICSHDTCEDAATRAGYCGVHYLRKWRGSDMDAPIRRKKKLNGEWSEWRVLKSGYVRRDRWHSDTKTQEIQLQHHYVWELYNGSVPKGHTVHHRNTNRSDNRIENLELWVGGQPKGGRVEDVLPWCINTLMANGYVVIPPVD